MEITLDDALNLIGGQALELAILRKQNAQLTEQLKALQPPPPLAKDAK